MINNIHILLYIDISANAKFADDIDIAFFWHYYGVIEMNINMNANLV